MAGVLDRAVLPPGVQSHARLQFSAPAMTSNGRPIEHLALANEPGGGILPPPRDTHTHIRGLLRRAVSVARSPFNPSTNLSVGHVLWGGFFSLAACLLACLTPFNEHFSPRCALSMSAYGLVFFAYVFKRQNQLICTHVPLFLAKRIRSHACRRRSTLNYFVCFLRFVATLQCVPVYLLFRQSPRNMYADRVHEMGNK